MNNAAVLTYSKPEYDLLRAQATDLVKSGFLPYTVNTAEKAIVIKMLSDALDIHWLIGMQSIYIISGKPSVAPQLMLGLVYRSNLLESFEVADDGECCTVKMKRVNKSVHTETFSMEDARMMKTTEKDNNGVKRTISLSDKDNWKQQPKTMRKWRAIAAACRVVFPDVIWGIASYTPDELGADVTYTEDGNIIDIKAMPEDVPIPPRAEPIAPANGNGHKPAEPAEHKADEPTDESAGHWADNQDNWRTFVKMIEKLGTTIQEAETKLGRTLASYPTGREAAQAVEAVMKQPAKPKGDKVSKSNGKATVSITRNAPPEPPPAPAKNPMTGEPLPQQSLADAKPDAEPDKPPVISWFTDPDQTAPFFAHLESTYEKTPHDVLRGLGVDTWAAFASVQEAGQAVLKAATTQLWPMVARRVQVDKFGPPESGTKFIKFLTPIPLAWWQGRNKLVSYMREDGPGAGKVDWTPVLKWELGNEYDLPEPVRIFIRLDEKKNQIVIDRMESAETIPF